MLSRLVTSQFPVESQKRVISSVTASNFTEPFVPVFRVHLNLKGDETSPNFNQVGCNGLVDGSIYKMSIVARYVLHKHLC